MKLSVIIPHYNDVTRLKKCLNALVPQLEETCEVIVVDNNSTEDLEDLSSFSGSVLITSETKKGAAHARNKGVSLSKGQYLLFLDCDCIPQKDWISSALARCTPDIVFGGKVTVFNETPPPMNGAEAFEHVFAFNQEDYINNKNFSVTANLLVSREIFEKAGEFKAGVSEDTEWCLRLLPLGIPLEYEEKMVVSHPTRNNWSELKRKWLRLTSESFELHKNQKGSRLKWLLRAGLVFASGMVHIPKILLFSGLSGLEKLKAISTLVRLRTMRALWMTSQALGLSKTG
ncbi:MAG: glycosyltransferase family 2 protein [Sneathiellales bacterium]|nr:glycosyltransferase family 2 protein [Sneathiellales bacterium]